MSENNKPKEHQKRKFVEDQYKMLLRCSEKKDMTEWNEWRANKKSVPIKLEGADLKEANLWYADLEGAYLKDANLFRTILNRANLNGACLEEANLHEALLEHAQLINSHLKRADLRTADLRNAELTGAYFKDTELNGTSFENAKLNKAHLENAKLIGGKFERAYLGGAYLQGADLRFSSLKHAILNEAHLEGANLIGADLEGATFNRTNLEGADLIRTNLEGTDIYQANLCKTRLRAAIVDGKTLIWDCMIDNDTNFSGVGLESARVEPRLKVALQGNIRRKQWLKWYEEGSKCRRLLINPLVKLFWLASDYGRSTTRIIGCFFGLSLIFALLYLTFGADDGQGIIANLFVDHNTLSGHPVSIKPYIIPIRAIYFSIVTMTTLGFGDMYANSGSILGHILLTFQVLLGYVLLGALVTRFAILFTSSGPEKK